MKVIENGVVAKKIISVVEYDESIDSIIKIVMDVCSYRSLRWDTENHEAPYGCLMFFEEDFNDSMGKTITTSELYEPGDWMIIAVDLDGRYFVGNIDEQDARKAIEYKEEHDGV